MNYNKIILVGRLTRDPEPRTTPSGIQVTTFTVAVDRPQSSEARQQGAQKETDYIDIVTWRQTADYAANYLTKGKLVLVEGRLQIRPYTSQDGQNRKATEVVADNVRMMEKRQDSDGYGGDGGDMGGGRYAYAAPAPTRNPAPAREEAQAGYQPRSQGGNAGRPAGNAPAGNRAGGRNAAPPPQNDYDDDFSDPFDN